MPVKSSFTAGKGRRKTAAKRGAARPQPSRSSTSTKASIRNAILRLNQRWIAASLKMDLHFIDSFYAPDCIFHFQNGQVTDKRWVMNLLASGDVKFESIVNREIQLRIFGNTVVWAAKADLTESYQGARTTSNNLWLRLFVRSGKTWKAVAFQSTTIPKSPN
jgi:hypothetical protein